MSEPPKPKRGRPRTLDVDKTLDVAMHAYWREDPADVSINTICTLAAVSKPGLYREFGGEDGLMRAVLARYAAQVLPAIFDILGRGVAFAETLDALAQFVSTDPLMQTGCLFYKMRAGKHRLGPMTQAAIAEVDSQAVAAFTAYLDHRRAAGEWSAPHASATLARYLTEQIGLALTQRAAGQDTAEIRETMALALSVLTAR